jgi:hypothetical protein
MPSPKICHTVLYDIFKICLFLCGSSVNQALSLSLRFYYIRLYQHFHTYPMSEENLYKKVLISCGASLQMSFKIHEFIRGFIRETARCS